MKILSLNVFLILSSLFPTLIFADIRWINDNVDLGVINEADGDAAGEFRFINLGAEPIVILNVRSSCGCTKIDYPKDEILKCDTAVIKFKFDPTGRPGRVSKSLRVYFSGNQHENLFFSGKVIPSEETLTKRYPVKNDVLRFETDSLKMNSLIKGEKKYGMVGVYNTGEDVVKPILKMSGLPIDAGMMPKEIYPGETATISLFIDTSKIQGNGLKESSLTVSWGENSKNSINIPVLFFILPHSM